MLKPTVGTEMCLRSSLFLKKFTMVDLPELLRPMIKIEICFGFLSLFKIFINNFSKTIFAPQFFFGRNAHLGRASGMFILGFGTEFARTARSMKSYFWWKLYVLFKTSSYHFALSLRGLPLRNLVSRSLNCLKLPRAMLESFTFYSLFSPFTSWKNWFNKAESLLFCSYLFTSS